MAAAATIARRGGTRFTRAAPAEVPTDDHERSAMYQSVTRSIEVTVTPQYLAERSSPESGEYFWAYTIEITNRGAETVQLRTRHWRITDAMGRRQDVRGACGVCGPLPALHFAFGTTTRDRDRLVAGPTHPSGAMRGAAGGPTERHRFYR